MLKPPTEDEIFRFVQGSHACDHIHLTTQDLQGTWYQKIAPNPYAQGHFRACNYILHKLVPSTSIDFPARDASLLRTVPDSNSSLFWLREIHSQITEPLVRFSHGEGVVDAPTAYSVGHYRMDPDIAVTKPAPDPSIIPKLMHVWLTDYATFHEQIKSKVSNPYGLSQELAREVIRKSYNVNLFFSTAKPMGSCNQRLGRLLELAFRLKWFMPMKFYSPNWGDEYRKLIPDLQKYQDEQLPQLIERARAIRG